MLFKSRLEAFLTGIASAFDISGRLLIPELPIRSDKEALEDDFSKVSEDFQDTFNSKPLDF